MDWPLFWTYVLQVSIGSIVLRVATLWWIFRPTITKKNTSERIM